MTVTPAQTFQLAPVTSKKTPFVVRVNRFVARAVWAFTCWLFWLVIDAARTWPRVAIGVYAVAWAWVGAPMWVTGLGWWNLAVLAANPLTITVVFLAWFLRGQWGPRVELPPGDGEDPALIWRHMIASDRTVHVR